MKKEILSGAMMTAAFIAFATPGYADLSLGGNASVGIPAVDLSVGAQADKDNSSDIRGAAQLRAQSGVNTAANGRVRSDEKFETGAVIHGGTIETNTTTSTETQESIDAGRVNAKKHRVRRPLPSQHEIHDRSTGLQNRADAGAGAVGGIGVGSSNAAFSMGARQRTDFNQ